MTDTHSATTVKVPRMDEFMLHSFTPKQLIHFTILSLRTRAANIRKDDQYKVAVLEACGLGDVLPANLRAHYLHNAAAMEAVALELVEAYGEPEEWRK